jgi:hypothetical protein
MVGREGVGEKGGESGTVRMFLVICMIMSKIHEWDDGRGVMQRHKHAKSVTRRD